MNVVDETDAARRLELAVALVSLHTHAARAPGFGLLESMLRWRRGGALVGWTFEGFFLNFARDLAFFLSPPSLGRAASSGLARSRRLAREMALG